MQPALKPIADHAVNGHATIDRPEDGRHPRVWVGPAIAVYVWRYPLRLIHWGLVISIGALAFTGYYIHNPFILGNIKNPFLMGRFRFVHEAFGMAFLSLLLLRVYLLFAGNRWTRWRALVPVTKRQWTQMLEVAKFYAFIRPTPVSYVGHNPMAALSYVGIYALIGVEAITGLVMFNWLAHNPILGFFLGWVTHLINIQNVRLIHYCLMYVFLAFGVLHVHLALLVSSAEKRGLMDSIFTGYKIVPVDELEEDDVLAIEAEHGKITHK